MNDHSTPNLKANLCAMNLECAKLFMLFPWGGESKHQVLSKSSFPKKATFLKNVKEQHQCTIFDYFGKIVFSLQDRVYSCLILHPERYPPIIE